MSEELVSPKDRSAFDDVIIANVVRAAEMELRIANPGFSDGDLELLVNEKLAELDSIEIKKGEFKNQEEA